MIPNFMYFWRRLNCAEKQQLADDVGVLKVYLSQIAGGHRKPSDALVKRLLEARSELRQTMFL